MFLAVATAEEQSLVFCLQLDADKRLLLVAHAVLEGVLNERDEQHRSNQTVGQFIGNAHADAYMVGEAQLHQFQVIAQEVYIASQRYHGVIALIEHVAHEL